jgi:hypothetical protein
MDEVLFSVKTPLGYFATLRRQNWEKHEQRHEEIKGHLPNVRASLEAPLLIIEDTDGCHHYYEMGYGAGMTAGNFLHVLVQRFGTDDPGERTVVSMFFTRTIKKGDLLWQRTSSS